MDCLGTAISVALQYGVPVESLVNKFAHQRFEPMGMTTNPDIPFAKSLVDYIFRWMGMEFVPGYREANAPKRPSKTDRGTPSAAPDRAAEAPTRTTDPAVPMATGGNGMNGPSRVTMAASRTQTTRVISVLDQSHAALMGDAPACEVCGSITVRSGSCYKCMDCGNAMGCS